MSSPRASEDKYAVADGVAAGADVVANSEAGRLARQATMGGLAGPGQPRTSKWTKVKAQEKSKQATMEWYRPGYWSNVTDEHSCSVDMPLGTMARVICKRGPYYTFIYVALCVYIYSQKKDVSCAGVPGASPDNSFPACNQNPYAYQHIKLESSSPSNSTEVAYTDDWIAVGYYTSAWYTPYSAAFLHINDFHIMFNMLLLSVFGSILEFTEGRFYILVIYLAAAPLSFGFHGMTSDLNVRGASGVIYAIFAAQIALLLMNWRELRGERFTRLFGILVLFAGEVAQNMLNPNPVASHGAHVGGAAVGICVSVVCAKNVKVHWYEPILIVVAQSFYLVSCFTMWGTGQWWAGLLGFVVYPKICLDTYMYWRRATILRVLKRTAIAAGDSVAHALGVKHHVSNTANIAPIKATIQAVQKTVDLADKTIVAVNDVDDAVQKHGPTGALVIGVKRSVDKGVKAATSSKVAPTNE